MEINNLQTLKGFELKREIPKHIAIEGTAGSGKSTLLDSLRNIEGYNTVGEYGTLLDYSNGERFPNFPPENSADVIKSNALWAILEMRRKKELVNAGQNTKRLVVTDRSPISLFAFEYAKKVQGLPFEFTNLAKFYLRLESVNLFKEPSGYIFLLPQPKIILDRIEARGGRAMPFLRETSTIESIHEFMLKFSNTYLDPKQYIIIDNSSISLALTTKKVADYMKTNLHTESKPFCSLLKHLLTNSEI